MKSPKKIFLSSTCFDLIDLRAEIKASLEEIGYVVYISEASDFPVDTKISTYDNCLEVVRQCDIYLLIIHTRYGSPFRGTTEITLPDEFAGGEPSVTVAEYLTALDAGLEVRIWVRDFIWTASTNVNAGRADLDPDALPPGIDPSVFSFIEYIKNHPHEGGSWINQFHSVVDLKASITHWLTESSYADASEFRNAVGEICELLGYEFDRSLISAPEHKRVLARLREGPFDEQDAIWPVYRKSGNTASWHHLRDIFRDVSDELTRGVCDRALVVINAPFDAAVASDLKSHPHARRIRLITYDDLVSTLIPFNGYLQRIVHDFENFGEFANSSAVKDPVIDIMRRCDLFRYYVPLRGRCSPSDLYE